MHLPTDMLKKIYRVMSVAMILILFACSAKQPAPPETAPTYQFERLLVLPVDDMAEAYGENVTVQCRLCGNVFLPARYPGSVSRFLNFQKQKNS